MRKKERYRKFALILVIHNKEASKNTLIRHFFLPMKCKLWKRHKGVTDICAVYPNTLFGVFDTATILRVQF